MEKLVSLKVNKKVNNLKLFMGTSLLHVELKMIMEFTKARVLFPSTRQHNLVKILS